MIFNQLLILIPKVIHKYMITLIVLVLLWQLGEFHQKDKIKLTHGKSAEAKAVQEKKKAPKDESEPIVIKGEKPPKVEAKEEAPKKKAKKAAAPKADAAKAPAAAAFIQISGPPDITFKDGKGTEHKYDLSHDMTA